MDFDDSFFNDSFYYDENEEEFLDEHGIQSEFHLFSFVCYILMLCISLPGNILLLWALLRERKRKTTHDLFLLQLIAFDLILWMVMAVQADCVLNGGMYGIKTLFFFWALNNYVLILSAMMVNHYVSVVHASHLPAQFRRKIFMATPVLWLVSFVQIIKVLVNDATDRTLGFFDGSGLCLHALHVFTDFDVHMQIVIFFLIPFMILTFCCVHMCINTINGRINGHHKSSRAIFGMIAVFFLCLVPYNIFLFIKTMALQLGIQFEWTRTLQYTDLIIDTLPYLHCCLNPLLNLFGIQRFRRLLLVTCRTSSQRRDESYSLRSTSAAPPRDAEDVL